MNPNWEDMNLVLLPYHLKISELLGWYQFPEKDSFIKVWNTVLLFLARASNLFGNYSAVQQENTAMG